jgi:dTMP kinase
MSRGLYIVFEGGEGCGKGTQLKILAEQLELKYPGQVVCTREPGGTPFAEALREIIFHKGIYKDVKFDAETEARLFALARYHSLREVVGPALEEGKIVLADRSFYSSLVYQGIGRNLGMELVWDLNQEAVGDIKPNAIFLLDVRPEVGLARKKPGIEWNRFEAETIDFHLKVRTGYLKLAEANKTYFRVIDGQQPIEEVTGLIYPALNPFLVKWETKRELVLPGRERR